MSDFPNQMQASDAKSSPKSSRALIICGVIFVVLGGSYSIYLNVSWEKFLPTSTLLSNLESEDDRYSREIKDRFMTGKLSQSDIAKYLDASIALPLFHAADDHPAGARIKANVTPRMRLPDAERWRMTMKNDLMVDGEVVSTGNSDRVMPWSLASSQMLIEFPALKEGAHTLGVRSTYTIWEKGKEKDPNEVSCCKTILIERPIKIEGDIADYTKSTTSALLATSLLESTAVILVRGEINGERLLGFTLFENKLPIRIAAEIWMKPKNAKKYSRGGSICSGISQMIYIQNVPKQMNAASFDILLIPNGGIAYNAGIKEYFGGTLEWKGVRVAPNDVFERDDMERFVYEPSEVRPDLKSADKLKSGREL